MQAPSEKPKFVVATPGRSVCDDNARALHRHGALRFLALGTRRGTAGVPPERTRLNPAIGLAAYLGHRLRPGRGEAWSCALFPWFDRWVRRQLRPGDHVISSYGYANECFAFARAHGGRTFLDGGNSHPENYWQVISEEHARWGCALPPFPRSWYERGRAMLAEVDYVLSPSSYVTRSFLERGFKPEQILRNVYPLDLACFSPAAGPRPAARPLTVISTGAPSLRKGTPYLLEAFRLIRRAHPSARLLLTGPPHPSLAGVMGRFRDLPIEWSPPLPHPQLAERLRGADVFVLPSLEDGFARTVAEALACGLPVVTTPNTGASDLIQPGVNGEVVPIRDAEAIAGAVLMLADRVISRREPPPRMIDPARLSFENFEHEFIGQLQSLGLLPP